MKMRTPMQQLNDDPSFQLPKLDDAPVATVLKAVVEPVGFSVYCGNCGWAFEVPGQGDITVWAEEELQGSLGCPNCGSHNKVGC